MNRLAARVAGFAVPTVGIVTAIHLGRQQSWGEGLDGVVSGLWFTLPFAAVCGLRSWLEGQRRSALARTAGNEFVFGLMAGVVTWAGLWLGWTLPSVIGWRPHAFAINSVVTGLAGLVLPPAGRPLRAEPEAASGEPATDQG
jgi:hypothetical protein